MFANAGTLEIFVPAVTLSEPLPRRLEAAMLGFPAAIAPTRRSSTEVLNNMIELGARSEPAANFDAWMERRDSIGPEDRDALNATYETMRRLQTEGAITSGATLHAIWPDLSGSRARAKRQTW